MAPANHLFDCLVGTFKDGLYPTIAQISYPAVELQEGGCVPDGSTVAYTLDSAGDKDMSMDLFL
jgi:hypothetical protein